MAILTETFPGAPGGSNLALPAHELDDTEARLLQDALVDRPGEIRRRGPVQAASGSFAQLDHKASGLVICLDPQGADRYAVLNGNNSNGYFSVFSPDLSTKVNLDWPHVLPTTPTSVGQHFRIVHANPAIGGGVMVGVSSAIDADTPNQAIAYWRGGYRANSSGNTITFTRGSTAVTGTNFDTLLSPGMWIFSDTSAAGPGPYTATLIGCVLSVNSATSATLTAPAPYTGTAVSATFQALRGLYPKVVTGRITTDVSSTTVTGGLTKFTSQGLGSGSWNLYRASDSAWIGTVATVASDTSLTLSANAAISMVDTSYFALKADGDWTIDNTLNTSKVGFLNASYAERQWYANCGAQFQKTSRVWFSDTGDPEALDVTNDGDWIEINSTTMVNEPVQAIVPVYNALLAIKENETFAIGGSSKDNFSVRKVHDDGTLATGSVQPYGGGAIWAGREGIHFYDGIQVQNLTQSKLGDVWKNSIRSFDPETYRMYSMIVREHYFLFVEDLNPTVPIIKSNVSTTPTYWVVAINLPQRAITFMTNLRFRGGVVLPASAGKRVRYIVNDSTRGRFCDSDDLFDSEGVDTIATDGGTLGPDFYFESKKFNAGDSMRLKRFKQFGMHYLVQGADIKVDTVLGLNNIGATLSTTFPASTLTWDTLRTLIPNWDSVADEYATWSDLTQALFIPKKIRFLKRSQHFSFRLYQENSSVTRLRVGPYHVGYKQMRIGRV
jgi:hypothetical protein